MTSSKLFDTFSINEDLKWREHVVTVANKVSKWFGVLNKVKKLLPVGILSALYCTLVWAYLSGTVICVLQKHTIRINY